MAVVKKIFGIMMHDVVPTYIVDVLQKGCKFRLVGVVKQGPVVP